MIDFIGWVLYLYMLIGLFIGSIDASKLDDHYKEVTYKMRFFILFDRVLFWPYSLIFKRNL